MASATMDRLVHRAVKIVIEGKSYQMSLVPIIINRPGSIGTQATTTTRQPMLLREGLLGAANRLFRLPAGFYGLTTSDT